VRSTLALRMNGGDQRKHPLFSPIVSSIRALLQVALGVTPTVASVGTFAGLAAVNSVAAYVVLQQLTRSWSVAVTFALYYTFAFANVMIWSVPETYVVVSVVIIAYTAVLIGIVNSGVTSGRLGAAALVTGIAALINPPLLFQSVPTAHVAVRHRGWRPGLLVAATAAMLSVLLFWVVYLGFFGISPWRFLWDYSRKISSWANLVSPGTVSWVTLNFAVFSIVGPFDAPKPAAELADLAGYLHSPLRLAAVLGHLFAAGLALRYLRRADDELAQALAMLAAGLGLFYVYFNPWESILYAPQVVFPWTVILLRAFEAPDGRLLRRLVPILLPVTALANVLSVLG
jgi:hypothetical protein